MSPSLVLALLAPLALAPSSPREPAAAWAPEPAATAMQRGRPRHRAPSRPQGEGEADDGIGGARRIFGSAKVRISREDQEATFDPAEFQAKLDELTAKTTARRLRRRELQMQLVDEAQVQAWFQTCDHNRNGWISFTESAISLDFDRDRFHAFDEDRDGRLDPYEFDELYMNSIVSVGRFSPPKSARGSNPPPTRTPEQMRNAYDTNLDRGLDELELSVVLADYARTGVTGSGVLANLDDSGDGRLQVEELAGLNAILYPIDTGTAESTVPDALPATTIEELFGLVIPRGAGTGTPTPPQIVGPVLHFRRLDLDGDGYISVEDLETLLRPVRSPIRPLTVINTLDRDGDYRLDPTEFLGSLETRDR